MQSISPVTYADLAAPVQSTLYKFEIYDGAAWRDLTAFAGGSPLPGWSSRKRIDLPVPTANLTDFPVEVPLIADAAIGDGALATGYDIRFTAADGTTLLPYERESWTGGAGDDVTAIFWVKTDVATAGTYIWCYYGNAAAADGQDAEAVWDANFKAVYHMNDATTSTILDSTGNDNDGAKKAANEPVEADGKIAKGQDFDGANDYIRIADAASINGLFDNLTIDFWLNINNDAGWQAMVEFGNAGGYKANFWLADGHLYANFVNEDGTSQAQTSIIHFAETTWYHVALVYNQATLRGSIYINGAFDKDRAIAAKKIDTTLGTYFGIRQASASPFDGLLDEIRLSTVARSAEWIAYEYANMNPADGGLTWGAEEDVRKNHLKSLSLQLGGAGATPDPIAASWSAEIHNADGIFHPRHPTSAYSDYLRVGRKVRISYGATYGGTNYSWQRMIGYMDPPTFNSSDQTVSIGGGDYMTALTETALYSPNTYWGEMATFSSVTSTDVLGSEIYVEDSAVKNSMSDFDNMTNWTSLSHAIISSEEDDELSGDLGVYNAMVTKNQSGYTFGYAASNNVGSVTAGKLYKVSFRYKRVSAGCTFSLRVLETSTTNMMGTSGELSSTSWTPVSYYFTATKTTAVRLAAYVTGSGTNLICRFDLVSIKEVTSYINERYPMPEGCNGVYYATLNGVPLWYGDTDPPRGWLYDPLYKTFYFADGYYVTGGTSNLLVYYYTTQDILDVLCDVLAATPLYADRAAALAALNYIDPGVTIDKAWFETGTFCVGAIQKICERCGSRFWFAYDGTPTFLPAPTLDDPIVSLETRHADGLSTLQDLGEIRNNVVIEGIEQGAFSTAKDKDTSRLKSAAALDATSIAAYLERTHVATNHLFQDQTSLDAAATARLAEFKDPKWYATLNVPHNPIPLELGDTVGFKVPLSATLEVETRGIIRDISLSAQGFTYKVEMESGLMNIANYTTATVAVTTEQCKGWVLTNAGAGADVHFDLPAATVGMRIRLYNLAAQTITVDPNGTERIAVMTDTAGDYVRSDGVIGSCLELVCMVAGYWHMMDVVGVWTEEA